MPVSEIVFEDYPAGKSRIVDFKAKWIPESFEYVHTVRRFDFPAGDQPLIERLETLSLRCWDVFRLTGYARVDFRVDAAGEPWILEINGNPCVAPDAGFMAATAQAGISYAQTFQIIVNDALRRGYPEAAIDEMRSIVPGPLSQSHAS
jgi:D-alanine-D-alanine ligase